MKENQENADNLNENVQAEETGSQEQDAKNTAETSREEELLNQIQELNDKYLRLYSEFDNYKRRTNKERIEFAQSAGREVIQALLPVLDDFERAKKSVENSQDIAAVKEGIELIHHKLKSILSQKGLKEVESIGKDFDVDFHEAITKIPAPDVSLKGKVVDEVERGYLLGEKVIRFAKVVVGE